MKSKSDKWLAISQWTAEDFTTVYKNFNFK